MIKGEVAQLVRARGSYPRCREFESLPRHYQKPMQSRRLTFLCAIFFKLLLLNLSIASWAQSEDEFLFSSGEEYKKIRVVRVLSTDTIELENKEKIKLIGLRA